MKTFSSSDIISRLKTALNIKTDTELSDMLGIKKATLSNWRNRNSIDLPLVFTFCESINIDWLITGRGNPSLINNQADTIREHNQDNKELLALVVNQAEEIGRLKERIQNLESQNKADYPKATSRTMGYGSSLRPQGVPFAITGGDLMVAEPEI